MADPYKTARKTRKKYKTARQTALAAGDVTGANKAARHMRKHGNVMRKLKGKDVKGKIPARTTKKKVTKKVVPAVNIWETAKTHSDVWDRRWDTGGLKKTFGTRTRYGIPTRPDRWRDVAQASWQTRGIPEYRTGPGWDKRGWGTTPMGRRWYDPRTGTWRRG